MAQRILIVDDEESIRASLQKLLEYKGYEAVLAEDGPTALEILAEQSVDVMLLDIKMPRMDGMELLSRLRNHSKLPVIFLTSKDDEIDEMLGLRMGADDYITKPFSQRLLIERIRAILRRADTVEEGSAGETRDRVVVRGDLVMDPDRHMCTWRNEPVSLTVTEFLILQSLATRPGHVKSRDQLMDAAYGENIYVDDRTIDSHIKRLRKKFKAADNEFDQIETLYGIGYRYSEN